MQRLINRVYGLLVSALFWLFATPEANTPEANTPEANTPEANTPEANTPEANTPEANTPEVVEFYGFTVTDGWD